MIEKDGERWVESMSTKKEKIKHAFSEELLLDLMWGHSWDEYDTLPNQYAYKLIDEEHGKDVIDYIKKFNPTRQLFERLLENHYYDVIDIITLFKGLNKGTLEKILLNRPCCFCDLKRDTFGVDKDTWMRFSLVYEEILSFDDEEDAQEHYQSIYEKFFSMNKDILKIYYENSYYAREFDH